MNLADPIAAMDEVPMNEPSRGSIVVAELVMKSFSVTSRSFNIHIAKR